VANNIFHSTSVRLTAVYLSIIMMISLIFSINSFRSYAQEINNSVRRPLPQSIRSLPVSEIEEIVLERQKFAENSKQSYARQLLFLNILILSIGGLTSYYLARKSLRPIEDAHEAQSRFTSDASHELRTPISAMRIETEITLSDPKLTLSKSKKQLESNIEELDKLTNLTNTLLQLSRLQSEPLEKELESTSVIVDEAVKRVGASLRQKKQKVVRKNIDTSPISVNRAAMVEALVTILDNASKFSPDGSNIVIAKVSQKDSIALSVADKGVGISDGVVEHIFDRFYQVDSSRTDSAHSGFGIGLSLAKTIVEAHNGTIDVKSKPKKGSTFTLNLPISN
jgi:two-component system sensor histidine kinase CiaH